MNFLDTNSGEQILNLNEFRRSPSPGADASRPKYQITTPSGEIYFKFQLTNNEICAEITAYQLAVNLDIPAAKTSLSKYKENIGIASYDIGIYEEPDDSLSYSVKDFLEIEGFVQMCLFDYLTSCGKVKVQMNGNANINRHSMELFPECIVPYLVKDDATRFSTAEGIVYDLRNQPSTRGLIGRIIVNF